MVAPALLRVMFIIRVTPRSQGPRTLSSVTRAKSSPKQPTTTCIQYAWGPQTHEALRAAGSARVLSTPLVLGTTRRFMTKTRFVPMVTVKMNSSLRPHCLSYVGKDFLRAFVQNRQILYVLDIQRTVHRDLFL